MIYILSWTAMYKRYINSIIIIIIIIGQQKSIRKFFPALKKIQGLFKDLR